MNILALLMSFCGGAFGAALGALAAFIFVGITGTLGVIAVMAGAQFDWLGLIPFGVFFGPHISFAGGAAAAAFASRMGYMDTGKDIAKGLMSTQKPVVLIVGGIFGMVGYISNYLIAMVLPGKIDSIAAAVFVVAIIAKIAFGGEIFGKVPEEIKKLGGRYSIKSTGVWLPWVNTTAQKYLIGLFAGGLSAYVTYLMLQDPSTAPIAAFVGFCISVTSLIFLQFGTEIPVTHHITLCASYAVVASGGNLMWGFVAGVVAAFAGDFCARTFHVFGDCHIDPPATSIALVSLIFLGILPLTGIYNIMGNFIPALVLVLFLVYSIIRSVSLIKNQSLESKEAV